VLAGPRIVIIGNSGSGKSTLAKAIAAQSDLPAHDLDRIHWLNKVGIKRDEEQAKAMVAALAKQSRWIIEGVFGWLAEPALLRATSLIWLDLPWSACRQNLATRGAWSGATPAEHEDFLRWAEAYWQRTTPSSFAGHLALYEGFAGMKQRMQSRSGIDDLLLGFSS